MTNVWRVSEVMDNGGQPDGYLNPSPLVGEGGSGAQHRGRVRGNAQGLTKRQLLAPGTVLRSRTLRRNASDPERRLFRALREAFPTARSRFQVPFGPYHADFCSHGAKLIIEVDGDTHASTEASDAARIRFLNGEGYSVIRFSNADVMQNIEGVIASVSAHLPSPLVGEGGAKRRMRGSKEA